MVILLTGDNTHQMAQEILRLERELGVVAERVDVSLLDQSALADIMKGTSLFAQTRLVILADLSSKVELWNQAAEWLSLVDDATTLVLREPKPDKRTKAYKTFAKDAAVIEAVSWSERQRGLAEKWLGAASHDHGVKLTSTQTQDMVARALVHGAKAGQRVVDQELLMRAIETLSGVATVTDDMIATVMPESTSDAVFDLIEIAVRGDTGLLRSRLDELRLSQDGYQLFALIVLQWSQLVIVTLARGGEVPDIHPFVRQKLQALASKVTHTQLRDSTRVAALLDIQLKSTGLSPWDATTRLLVGLANR